jgi:CheY-like chemotaxis protein
LLPILIVDNEPQVRSLVNRLLSRQGFQVIEAHDGPSALAAVQERSGKVRALLTDIEMDGMSGIALAKIVTAEFPNIPVLFVTAVPTSGEELRRDVPSCAFVQKPFDPALLVRLLRHLMVPCE